MDPSMYIDLAISFIIGVVIPSAYLYPKLVVALNYLTDLLKLVQTFRKARADGEWTDEEYKELGKEARALGDRVDADVQVATSYLEAKLK